MHLNEWRGIAMPNRREERPTRLSEETVHFKTLPNTAFLKRHKKKQQPKGENQKGKKENEVMSYLLERCFHRVDLLNRPRFQ